MAQFNRVQIQKVENGYVVSITELEFGDRGWQPVEKHKVATNWDQVLDLIGGKEESVPTIAL